MRGKRQKNQLELAFEGEGRGGASGISREGTEPLAAGRGTESLELPERLMEEVLRGREPEKALQRVKANKGSPGIDGMTVEQLSGYLEKYWPAHREQLLGRGLSAAAASAGGECEDGWRESQAFGSDGSGSFHPAGSLAGSPEQVGPEPHGLGTLRINPLYREIGRSADGRVSLELEMPSEWFAFENGECRRYMLGRIDVGKSALEDLSAQKRSAAVSELLRQCVVVGLPEAYF